MSFFLLGLWIVFLFVLTFGYVLLILILLGNLVFFLWFLWFLLTSLFVLCLWCRSFRVIFKINTCDETLLWFCGMCLILIWLLFVMWFFGPYRFGFFGSCSFVPYWMYWFALYASWCFCAVFYVCLCFFYAVIVFRSCLSVQILIVLFVYSDFSFCQQMLNTLSLIWRPVHFLFIALEFCCFYAFFELFFVLFFLFCCLFLMLFFVVFLDVNCMYVVTICFLSKLVYAVLVFCWLLI